MVFLRCGDLGEALPIHTHLHGDFLDAGFPDGRRIQAHRDSRDAIYALKVEGMVFSFPTAAENWDDAVAAYAPVLAQYEAAFTGDEDAMMTRESAEDAYRCALYAQRDPRDVIGYLYLDLNGDGVPELVIGTAADAGSIGDQLIFEILTLKDNEPVTMIRGWERFRVQLTLNENDVPDAYGYYAEGSSGASNSVYEHGIAGADMTRWEDVHTLEVNYDESNRAHWTLDGAQIKETQANAMLEAWQKLAMRVSLPSFSAHEYERVMGRSDAPDCVYRLSASVRKEGPVLNIIIRDTGRRNPPEEMRENILGVTVSLPDGDVIQQFEYSSSETPAQDAIAALAWMQDLNFDGYRDLVLCTAQGASNEFSVFCLWNPESGRFEPIQTEHVFDLETERFSDEIVPLELVNYSLKKDGNDHGFLCSYENDGVACYTQRVYRWDVPGPALDLKQVYDVNAIEFSDESGPLRERLFVFGTQGEKVWDHEYDIRWFYGETSPYADHEAGAETYWLSEPVYKRVANVDWVNLRERDSKQSESLAHLDRGTEVRVRKENCADGWTLVLWDTGKPRNEWFGNRTEIGYIWHSFLE